MSRISIDVTPKQHQRLKALAALRGKTIKDFVLERTLTPDSNSADEDLALSELETLLDERLNAVDSKGTSTLTVGEIFQDEYRKSKS